MRINDTQLSKHREKTAQKTKIQGASLPSAHFRVRGDHIKCP